MNTHDVLNIIYRIGKKLLNQGKVKGVIREYNNITLEVDTFRDVEIKVEELDENLFNITITTILWPVDSDYEPETNVVYSETYDFTSVTPTEFENTIYNELIRIIETIY